MKRIIALVLCIIIFLTHVASAAQYYSVSGDSMNPTFKDGDIVKVEEQDKYNDGDTVIADVGGKKVIKRIDGDKLVGDNKIASASYNLSMMDIIGKAEYSTDELTDEEKREFGKVFASGVEMVAAGYTHTVALRRDGTVWTWGSNGSGQLGNGTTENSKLPMQVKDSSGTGYLTDIIKISAREYHTVVLKNDGTVWAWGYNSHGQLGNGTTTNSNLPVQLMDALGTGYLTDIIQISTGDYHAVALKNDGSVWAWGYNSYGGLGNGTTTSTKLPIQVKDSLGTGYLTDIKQVSVGNAYTLALKNDGTVWAWGYNYNGQLGDGTTTNTKLPIQVKNVSGSGYLTNIIQISAGNNYVIALKNDGTVWAWGYNANGQLGNGTATSTKLPVQVKNSIGTGYINNIIQIAAGKYHSAALKEDGTAWTWGNNYNGELGNNMTSTVTLPIQVKDELGTEYLRDITQISAGVYHTVALKDDGTVWTWGDNEYAQLGNNSTTDVKLPARVNGLVGCDYFNLIDNTCQSCIILGPTCKITASTSDITSENNITYTFKFSKTVMNFDKSDIIVTNGTKGNFIKVDSDTYTLIVTNSGNTVQTVRIPEGVYADTSGNIGTASMKVITIMNGIVQISGGENNTVALKSDGTVWIWGDNEYGQLGESTIMSSGIPTQVKDSTGTGYLTNIVQTSAGDEHIVALKSDGTVWAWGRNYLGELGNGTTIEARLPVQVKDPSGTEYLTGIKQISTGSSSTFALKNDGTVWAWGYNEGNLGDGKYQTSRKLPVQVKDYLGTGYLTDITQIVAGYRHTVALKSDGTVLNWGSNKYGGLGDNTNIGKYTPVPVRDPSGIGCLTGIVQVWAGKYYTVALKNDGTVWTWGYNGSGQLGNGTTTDAKLPIQVKDSSGIGNLTGIVQISAGQGDHIVALKEDGTVWTWGENSDGQLGNNTKINTNLPVQVYDKLGTGYLTDIVQISAGGQHTVALKSDGTVLAWGDVLRMKLGNSTIQDSVLPIYVIGENGCEYFTVNATCLSCTNPNPTCIITTSTPDITSESSIIYTFQFSNEVIGFDASDITVTNGVKGAFTAIDGDTYTLVVTNTGNVVQTVSVASGAYTDTTGTLGYAAMKVITVMGGIVQISGGGYHTVALKSDGTVWTWGRNSSGELGNGTFTTSRTPVQVKNSLGTEYLTGIVQVLAGGYYTVALKNDGTVWVWGDNFIGTLGNGTTTNSNLPVQVKDSLGTGYLTDIAQISAGYRHIMALKSDGTVWGWGNNNSRQLGNGSSATHSSLPVQVKDYAETGYLTGVTQISAGDNHTIALKSDGTVWSWGSNSFGQLGDDTNIDRRSTPVAVRDSSGTGCLTSIVQVSGGGNHTVALRSDGTVWAWGNNDNGQLGNDTTTNVKTPIQVKDSLGTGYLTGVAQISSGYRHTVVLKNDGTVWAWGDNYYGQLGNNATTDTSLPVRVKDSLGTEYLKDIVQVSAGEYHTIGLKSSGTVWAWGNNGSGQLGNNGNVSRNIPIPVRESDLCKFFNLLNNTCEECIIQNPTCTITASTPDMTSQSSITYTFKFSKTVIDFDVNDITVTNGTKGTFNVVDGYTYTLNVTNGGNGIQTVSIAEGVYADTVGNLGNAAMKVINIMDGTAEISGGIYNTLVIKSDGTVWTWGGNSYGQLGDGTTTNRYTPVQVRDSSGTGYLKGVVHVSGGQYHTVALKSDGTVWAWGYNNYGQLGDGTTTSSNIPVQVRDSSGTGYLTGITKISAGYSHVVALKNDGTVWAWGYNNYGQLGDGTTTNSNIPVQVKDVSGTGYLSGIIKISVGYSHAVVLRNDGTLWAWGYNYYGQLGDDSRINRYTPVPVKDSLGIHCLTGIIQMEAGFYHTVGLKNDGTVWTWGYNANGQLGDNTTTNSSLPVQVKDYAGTEYLTKIVHITTKGYHSIALKNNGTVWAWGRNDVGQLGEGTTTNSIVPVQVKDSLGTGYLTEIVKISSGGWHSVALKSNGTVWTTGNNDAGRLGDGTMANYSLSIQVKGVNEFGYFNLLDITSPTLVITTNKLSDSSTYTFTFDEPVTNFSIDDITVTNGIKDNFTSISSTEYKLIVNDTASGAQTINVSAGVCTDASGNPNKEGIELLLNDDEISPTVAITYSVTGPYNEGKVVTIRATFSEAVKDSPIPKISISGANTLAATNMTKTSTTVYTYVHTVGEGDGIATVSIGLAQDLAGNVVIGEPTSGATFTVDNTVPSVVITSTPSANPTNANSITYTFTFSEAVTGFTIDDITVSNGNKVSFVVADTSTYMLLVNSVADGTQTVSVLAGVCQDSVGNNNTSAGRTVTIDRTVPTVSITATPSANPTNASSITYTFTFSEAVTGFTADDIAVLNGIKGTFEATSTSVYTLVVTYLADGEQTVGLSAGVCTDTAGNGNTSVSRTVTIERMGPTATITASTSDITNATSITYTIQFTKPVTGFTVNDITVTNGEKDAFTAESSTKYTLVVTNTGTTTQTITIPAGACKDSTGNDNVEITKTISIDTIPPTIIVTPTKRTSSPDSITGVTIAVSDDLGVSAWQYQWIESSIKPSEGWKTGTGQASKTMPDPGIGVWYLHAEALDTAGNYKYVYYGPYIKIPATLDIPNDAIPPTITADVENRAGGTTDIKVNLTVTDNIKVREWKYIWSALQVKPSAGWLVETTAITKEITQGQLGKWYLYVDAEDLKGNKTEKRFGPYEKTAKDMYGPTITVDKTTRALSTSDIPVRMTITDASGVGNYKYQWTTSTLKPLTGWTETTVTGTQTTVTRDTTRTVDGIWYLHIEATDSSTQANKNYKYYGPYARGTAATTNNGFAPGTSADDRKYFKYYIGLDGEDQTRTLLVAPKADGINDDGTGVEKDGFTKSRILDGAGRFIIGIYYIDTKGIIQVYNGR